MIFKILGLTIKIGVSKTPANYKKKRESAIVLLCYIT
jgi:hypothetical protein